MPETGRSLVTFALKKAGILGIGRAASANDATDALADLNDMLSEWNTQRLMIWNLLDIALVSTGASTYTVGPAGDFAVSPRPDRLEAGYQRQLVTSGLNVDTPMEIIASKEEYSRLSLKSLVSFGLYLFLDTSYPLGVLRPYPIPNASIYEIHIIVKNVCPVLALDTALDTLPPHYVPAIKFNLARRLRQAYGKGKTPDTELNNLARNSLQVVTDSNIQVPELVMPKALITMSSGYNILNDQFGNA